MYDFPFRMFYLALKFYFYQLACSVHKCLSPYWSGNSCWSGNSLQVKIHLLNPQDV